MTEYIQFKNRDTGKHYAAISLNEATREEVAATMELIAYEEGITIESVTYELIEK